MEAADSEAVEATARLRKRGGGGGGGMGGGEGWGEEDAVARRRVWTLKEAATIDTEEEENAEIFRQACIMSTQNCTDEARKWRF